MATQEKLQKSLEVLRNASKSNPDTLKKKEKNQHCYLITEAISNPTIRISTNFHVLLGNSIETFLKLCDDNDADVRMTSEECLNRIIRAASGGHIGKIQIELHKEIKKNGSARSLRAALWLFSLLAHHIRPLKGKPYVANLFPSLMKVTERSEESVHETLALSLPKILKVLGCFTTESEMKALLRCFLKNINNDSAAIRRTTTSCILSICVNCRKSSIFLTYCLTYLLDLLLPINVEESHSLILGTISCIKSLIPLLKNNEVQEINAGLATEKLLQVFELCLFFLPHKDHNVVNVCLETLNTLIQHSTEDVKKALLNDMGLGFSRISLKNKSVLMKPRSPSELSTSTTLTTEDNLFSDTELLETIHMDFEKWIDDSRLSVLSASIDSGMKDRSQSLNTVSDWNPQPLSDVNDYEKLDELNTNFVSKLKTHSGDNLDDFGSETSSQKSFSASTDDNILNIDDLQEIDIGDLLDTNVPLAYCIRLIAKRFLLKESPGNITSDKTVRVSVKFLALSCLSSVFRLYPSGMFLYLDKNYSKFTSPKHVSSQNISSILTYVGHSDPQLRGAMRILLADFVKTVFIFGEDYERFILGYLEAEETQAFLGQELIDIFVQGLQDESANCIRQTLLSLQTVLDYLCKSKLNKEVTSLLDLLPFLAKNPYWLVKVSLCELVTKIDYTAIYYLSGNSSFQDKVIFSILFELLGDCDQRVRGSAATSIVEIIPNLYFQEYTVKEDVITSKAVSQRQPLLNLLEQIEIETNVNTKHFIRQMPFPFCELFKNSCDRTEFCLSKIIFKLYSILTTSDSKCLISGCIETLCLLSNTYPCTVYKCSWGTNEHIKDPSKCMPDLLKLCISFLLDTDLVYDFQVHISLLNLSTNLYAGHALSSIKPCVSTENFSNNLWNMFANDSLGNISEHYLEHSFKLLNIFHHVLNETLPVNPQSKTVLPNIPATSTLSPIKRRKSDLDKKSLTLGKSEREEKSDRRESLKQNLLGLFVGSSRYMKIFDMLKSAFVNYKISLESDSSQTFLEMLLAVLRSLSVLMEVGSLAEFSRIAEEMLNIFRSTFIVDGPTTVQGVQQLLKCLFGTNLTSNISEFSRKEKEVNEDTEEGFYFNVFQKTYPLIAKSINLLGSAVKDLDDDTTVMGYLHRKDIKRRSVVLTRSSDKVLENYIRIFESMVIKSLKQYTLTSDIKLQCQVLQLLSQLVQLRVNYCMLDSEQVFIGFVLKQFEYIEEGQISFPEDLIPKIFQFLVQLSYSKQHSKCIISIPKIIQLCDGLMASGQLAETHCIPALEPIVEDIFLTRNKSNSIDIKELETTREVVLSMLLRLWENEKVMRLITLILEDSKFCIDNSEKWYEWSKRVFAVILPAFKQNKIKINTCGTFVSLKRLIFSLNAEVFQPYDEVIVIFFQELPQPTCSLDFYSSWLSKSLLLLLIISSIEEDTLLAKINKRKSEFSPRSIFENVMTKADPLNVNNNADTFDKIPAELVFIRFVFRVITVISEKCLWIVRNEEDSLLMVQLSVFILHCSYLFQSGSHRKITKTAISLFHNISFGEQDIIKLNSINEKFVKLSFFHPLLTFYWCYFLTLLNYSDRYFYSKLLDMNENSFETNRLHCFSINQEIARVGILISLCDYMIENLSDLEYLTWLLSKYCLLLVQLCDEPPISEFVSSVHRNPTLSAIFLSAVADSVTSIHSSIFKVKVLRCIENCHVTQIGAVLKLVIPNMLKMHQVSIARDAANLASRKVEILLTLSMEDVNSQLPKEDLVEIQNSLVSLKLVQKYETLVSFLNKLSSQYYDLSPLEFEQRKVVNPEYIRKLNINKKWYFSQIQMRYNDKNIGRETAELLSQLEYNEIISFMSSSSFNKYCLKDCLKMSLRQQGKQLLDGESDIVRASITCLWKDIISIADRIPEIHQVNSGVCTTGRRRHDSETTRIFQNEEFLQLLHSITPCVPLFLSYQSSLDEVSDKHLIDLMKFAVISLEYISLIDEQDTNFSIQSIDVFLDSVKEIFSQRRISQLLESDVNILWFCSSVNSLICLVSVLINKDRPLPSVPNYLFEENSTNSEGTQIFQVVHQLYTLVCWFLDTKSVSNSKVPGFLLNPIKVITVSLSRLSVAYSYIMIPMRAWKSGWRPDRVSGRFKTKIPPLPVEVLQDIEVLEEYIFRINSIGWTSRQQFEETWMCLLSVLWSPVDDLDGLELSDVLHSSSLAIKSITALLLETLTCSEAGNPNLSSLIHIPRNLTLSDDSLSIKKLKDMQERIQLAYKEHSSTYRMEIPNIFYPCNLEKRGTNYSYGQLSIKYFLAATDIFKGSDSHSLVTDACKRRTKMLEECGLDVNSCLQFLIDYYTQLIKPESNTHIRVLHEAVKSTVMISDIFTEKSQFSWMLELFFDLSKFHAVEDELLHQYLIIGICKATGVLTPELETYEQVKKLLVQYLKSPYLSSRISCLYGLLYILEGCRYSNISIGGISDEMQLILPCAVEYVQLNLCTTNSVLKKSHEHSLLVWSLAFYLLENIEETHMEKNFVSNTLTTAFEVLSNKCMGPLQQSVIKGLERLLVIKKRSIMDSFGKQYRKLALGKVKSDSPIAALLGTQLLLTYMYTDCAEHLQNVPSYSNMPTNPDHLVQTIEKISAIFEHIKRGHVFEVEILCTVLPSVLDDFFSPSDILTKVIGEFLSPQQPHPKLLSKVVFQVFQSAIHRDQMSLLRDWVVFSLSNFTQSFSIGMATWCLTCFFISASSNGWLRAYFPYVQTRAGRYEYEDKKMLCIAGADFYNALTNDKQKETFVETFRKVKDQADTPYNDLLLSL